MNKKFETKIYGLDGTFKRTLKGTERITDFSYSSQINGGQGESKIELNKTFDDSTYVQGDFVKVFLYSDLYPAGLLVYTGMVSQIERIYTNGIQKIILNCLGLSSLLSSVQYNATKNQDPAQTIKDIIDYFNTKYAGSWLSYSGGFMDNFGSSINITFTNKNCLDAIKDVAKTTNFWWFIDQAGQVHFKAIPVAVIHTFTAGKDLDSIMVNEDSEKIVNKVYIKYTGGTTSAEDVTSQTTYGIKEEYQDKSDLQDLTSANSFGTSYIAKNKDIKKKISLIINDNYRHKGPHYWDDIMYWSDTVSPWDGTPNWEDFGTTVGIEYLQPGDTVKVLNINYSIINLQIQKIDYTVNNIKLELSEYDTLAKEILQS